MTQVLLVITDQDFYAGTGYAQAWLGALQAEGASVQRLARMPASWTSTGPVIPDLVIAHVLVEEVASYGESMQLAAALESAGALLLNPVRCLVTSADKLATAAVWAAAGIPQPRTVDRARLTAWPGEGPMVLKPALGDGARHIAVVHGLSEVDDIVASWRRDEAQGGELRGAAVLQEWVREPVCVRLFATPTSTSLAYEKSRRPGELVTCGTVYPRIYPPPAAMADLARRMVASLGGGLMGVDVLVGTDGRLLALEANAPFGFDITDPEQGAFVARAALAHLRSR